MLIITMVVALLQVPYAAHQVSIRFSNSAMGAVTGSLGRILSGAEQPRFANSLDAYARAFNFIEVSPWQISWAVWILVVCSAIVASNYRRDPALLAVLLLPQVAALIGYACFLADLDSYYYLSLMPGAVITMLLGATALPGRRFARVISIALLVGSLALVPARIRYAALLHKMPEYGALVDGSRKMASRAQPIRAIETEFNQPFTANAEYLYRILGGRIDPESRWIGVIKPDGSVFYRSPKP